MFYEGAVIISCAFFIVLSIFAIGAAVGWRRKAIYWKDRYYDAIAKVEPPTVTKDPYDGVKTALEYNWEEVWD